MHGQQNIKISLTYLRIGYIVIKNTALRWSLTASLSNQVSWKSANWFRSSTERRHRHIQTCQGSGDNVCLVPLRQKRK